MKKRFELIATAFDAKRKVIGSGVNDYNKSHPLMKMYALKAKESCAKIKKHAELSALLSAGNKIVHSMLVQRFDSLGNPALAMPCPTCQVLLKDFGVKFVEFTSPDGIRKLIL